MELKTIKKEHLLDWLKLTFCFRMKKEKKIKNG